MSNESVPLASAGNHVVRRIRELARDSGLVFFSRHVKERMAERGITRPQVLRALQKGVIAEPAHLNTHHNWQASFKYRCAGDEITVAAALHRDEETGDTVVVITAF